MAKHVCFVILEPESALFTKRKTTPTSLNEEGGTYTPHCQF